MATSFEKGVYIKEASAYYITITRHSKARGVYIEAMHCNIHNKYLIRQLLSAQVKQGIKERLETVGEGEKKGYSHIYIKSILQDH